MITAKTKVWIKYSYKYFYKTVNRKVNERINYNNNTVRKQKKPGRTEQTMWLSWWSDCLPTQSFIP